MIPPLKPLRIRSITRWLKDSRSAAQASPQKRESPQEIDRRMMETFGENEDALMSSMMKAKTWGTQEGLREFNTRRLEMWDEVVSQYLPTSALSLEG